jgi:putative transposase
LPSGIFKVGDDEMPEQFDPDLHHRRSLRLNGYDYTEEGAYFVTVCTFNREFLYGEILDDEMLLNGLGEIVAECWMGIPQHFPRAEID